MTWTIETGRLYMRPFVEEDANALLALTSNPLVLKYLHERPLSNTTEAAAALRNGPLSDYARYGFGRLAVLERGSAVVIGFCGLKFLKEIGEVDLGYRFLPGYWGKGYAKESASAVLTHGQSRLRLGRIIGLVSPANTASVQVLLHVGMTYERPIEHASLGGRYDQYAC